MREKSIDPDSGGTTRRFLRSLGWFAFSGIGAYLTVCVGAALPLSNVLIRPKPMRTSRLTNPRLKQFLLRRGLNLEDVSFSSFDSVRLHGWWVGASPSQPTILLLHGVKGNRTDMVRFALTLAKARFNILLFDGRHHGLSEGQYVTYGGLEVKDVESAIDFLVSEKQIDPKRVGLAGLSMGAAISLQTAALHPEIQAVWADSPFASLRRVSKEFLQRYVRVPGRMLKPLEWSTFALIKRRGNFDTGQLDLLPLAPKIRCPVFLVHGDCDELIPHQHSRDLYEALSSEGRLWIIAGATHTSCQRDGGALYASRLVDFFTDAFSGLPRKTSAA